MEVLQYRVVFEVWSRNLSRNWNNLSKRCQEAAGSKKSRVCHGILAGHRGCDVLPHFSPCDVFSSEDGSKILRTAAQALLTHVHGLWDAGELWSQLWPHFLPQPEPDGADQMQWLDPLLPLISLLFSGMKLLESCFHSLSLPAGWEKQIPKMSWACSQPLLRGAQQQERGRNGCTGNSSRTRGKTSSLGGEWHRQGREGVECPSLGTFRTLWTLTGDIPELSGHNPVLWNGSDPHWGHPRSLWTLSGDIPDPSVHTPVPWDGSHPHWGHSEPSGHSLGTFRALCSHSCTLGCLWSSLGTF